MGPALRTALREALGIEYPIFSVGFGSAPVPELAAAVSNAGGLGVRGASGMDPAEITGRIAKTRNLTRSPFGINFIIDEESEEDHAFKLDQMATAIAGNVAVVVLFWGDPAP
jgi:enoyl-[acyl-carrier protein] reductase II